MTTISSSLDHSPSSFLKCIHVAVNLKWLLLIRFDQVDGRLPVSVVVSIIAVLIVGQDGSGWRGNNWTEEKEEYHVNDDIKKFLENKMADNIDDLIF